MFDRPLTLRDELKTSWLIQRLKKPMIFRVAGKEMDNPFSFGGGLKNGGLSDDAMKLMRHIFSFDYMGSSEFEWGAVPQALRFIAEQSEKKNIKTGIVYIGKEKKDKNVYFVCAKPHSEQVKKRITEVYENKIRLKEWCGLNNVIDDPKYKDRFGGWLELDNGFAFFTNVDMYKEFCKLLGIE